MKLSRLLAPSLVLVVLVVGFYRGLVLQGLVVGDYDAFVYFYPLREYAARVLGQGGFPLWNPYTFMGAPFFANIQTAVLYPLNLLFLLLPAPYAFSASVVLHVLLAGFGMYLFGRRILEVSPLPALMGAIVFAFGGFISAQVSHINQLSVSAWLPMLLVVFDLALRRRSVSLAVITGLIGTMQFLAGHTQEWYFSTVTLGLLALWRIAGPFPLPPVGPWKGIQNAPVVAGSNAWARYVPLARRLTPLGLLMIAGLVEAGLSAIQLLPTAELSGESIRGGGMAYGEAVSFSLPPSTLLYTLLPTYPSTLFSEYVGYLGVAPLVLAAMSLVSWKKRPVVMAMVGLTIFGLLMAIGGYNPLAPYLFRWVPGLDLFRVPARWLLIYTLGGAGLAALGAQMLMDLAPNPRLQAVPNRPVGRAGFALAASLLGVAALVIGLSAFVARPAPSMSAILPWVAVGSVAAALCAAAHLRPRLATASLVALLAVATAELWAAGGSLSVRFPVPFSAYSPQREGTSFILQRLASDPAPERVLSVATDSYEVKETPDYKNLYSWLTPRALTQFLVDIKLNETLAPNLPMKYRIESPDGYDGGVLPLKKYAELKSAIIPAQDSAPDSLLRNNLPYVPSERLLDLMGVKYILGGKITDASVENVYYDRGISVEVRAGQSRTLERIEPIQATSIGVISSASGARQLPTGTVVGTIAVTSESGERFELPLRLGLETAEGAEQDGKLGAPAHTRPEQVAIWPAGTKDTDYFAKIRLPSRARIRSVSFQGTLPDASVRVRALTLIDDQAALIAPLVLSDRLDRQLFFDTKVYSYRDSLPRAFMAYNSAVRDDELALAELESGAMDLRQTVVLAPSKTAKGISRSPALGFNPGDARVVSYRPEEVVIETSGREDGYLVLMDAHYPGWIAEVDGKAVGVERANYLFRGVWLERGSHRVVFRYSPASFETGKWISGASILFVVAALVAARWGSRQRRPVL